MKEEETILLLLAARHSTVEKTELHIKEFAMSRDFA